MPNPILTDNFRAEAVISKRTIVKHGAVDGTVVPATAATDLIIGVSEQIDSAIGQSCDVILQGIADIAAGAAFARGARLTTDATSRAIIAAPAAGSNVQILGIALAAATAAGDIVPVLVSQSVMQG